MEVQILKILKNASVLKIEKYYPTKNIKFVLFEDENYL